MDLTGEQKKTIIAAFLGWMLDAFDFFLLTFLLKDIAKEFGVEVPAVAYALFLTLAMRFVGAFIFGRLGDLWGRKPALMLDILCYSILGALAAFSPNLTVFLILRALFGIAMGGEWGLGSSLAMESIPPQARGLVSGILQCGYPSGFLLAAIAYGILFGRTFGDYTLFGRTVGDYTIGWRAMFLLSVLPAFIVLFIRSGVPESPAFEASQAHEKPHLWATISDHKGLVIYMVVLMMCFNLFSHGTQDLYPTFLQKQHNFDPGTVSWIVIVANLGAIAGGLLFGHVSEKIGRVNAITVAALIALPALPLWAYASTPILLAVGAFIMQVAVQGAWGVIPAHLNELAPGAARATIPAFVYQAGNFLASYNGPFQAQIAESNGNNYAFALALVAGVIALAIVVVIRFSPERRGELLKAH
jgi:SHS family lactate transporter-like MFS transporter